jgi:hypothetical protein
MQIVDIVSLKPCKFGIIVCKNFHNIHSELLESFYSYIQQYASDNLAFQIKFVLLSEHVSFIPNNILHNAQIVNVKRPSREMYTRLGLPSEILPECVLNLKEISIIKNIGDVSDLPAETFNLVCDAIIKTISDPRKLTITDFRDTLYDILVYNLDIYETIWYILTHFIREGKLEQTSVSDILQNMYKQLQQYNNNYRPIYHLESIFITILNHIHNYKYQDAELSPKMRKRASNTRLKDNR